MDLQVLDYDDVVADPIEAVGKLMNTDISARPDLVERIGTVMAQDSQASHRLSRNATSRRPDDEEAWMDAFERAWSAKQGQGALPLDPR